jgi:RNA polymerase sigma-70 factor (ECF subfamily)
LLRGERIDDVATEAADDALVTILARLEEFRGASRFTTWACKFVILESSFALRKRSWKGRELPWDGDWWRLVPIAPGPAEEAERLELLQAIRRAVGEVLTERQREVFVAVALNDVPIDIVAARGGCTRGAVYKMLHDARRRLREQLDGLSVAATAGRPPAPR